MPRPPILPLIDWPAVFESGKYFDQWLSEAESDANREQMRDVLTRFTFTPEAEAALTALARPVHVVAIAEDWCGDVVRHAPVLARMAQVAPNLRARFISREQHPDVFARFLTNGGEAIPKFIFLSDDYVECGNWGPMPAVCRELIARGKACNNVGRAREKVAALYDADPHCEIVVDELLALIDIASSTEP